VSIHGDLKNMEPEKCASCGEPLTMIDVKVYRCYKFNKETGMYKLEFESIDSELCPNCENEIEIVWDKE
jgi:ribosomal protein L34E